MTSKSHTEPTYSASQGVGSPLKISNAVRDLLTHLPAVVYQCGPPPDFATTFVSDNVEAQLGYRPDQFYADPFFWSDRLHKNDRPGVSAKLSSIGDEDRISYEYRFRRSDGKYTWLHDQISVSRDDNHQIVGLVGSWFDISDRKRLETLQLGQTQVLEHLVKHRSLLETLEQIARVLESYDSEMICSVLRFDPITQTLLHGAAPSLPNEYNRQVDGLAIGPDRGSCGTAAFHRKRVVVSDIQTDPLWASYREVAAKFNLRACWSQPILSSSDRLLGTFAIYYREPRGPTEKELKLIEQAASLAALAFERFHDEKMVRHADRLASLGTLAAGIAHEINNPIGAIQLAAQNATTALAKGNMEGVRGMLSGIAADTERCARIIRGVLQFGRPSGLQKQPISLSAVVTSARNLCRAYVTERRAIVEVLPGVSDCEVLCGVVELEQVFVNLIRNGIESKDRGAHVGIRTTYDADFVCVTVSDDGRGISDENMARVFEPFFTTRQNEGGTGLGLSVVHGIVVGHGGTLRVESTPGKGTSVAVCLPRHE